MAIIHDILIPFSGSAAEWGVVRLSHVLNKTTVCWKEAAFKLLALKKKKKEFRTQPAEEDGCILYIY